jgi:hypothetical protein
MGAAAGNGRGRAVLVYAFDGESGTSYTTASPTNLRPDVIYQVVSVDSGPLGDATGADLMAHGIRIVRSPNSAAHILSLIPQP